MILENNDCRVEISNSGAEILHFIHKQSQKEWKWDGNKQFWDQHNPILFPIVGSTYDKKIRINGNIYEMGNHGFARRAYFKTVSESSIQCELVLMHSEETLKQYPFEFKLSVRYQLEGSKLMIQYTIENLSTLDMPFSIGFHPAFMTSQNGVSANQIVKFPNLENDLPESICDKETNTLVFNDQFFQKVPTLLLENCHSPYVILEDGNNTMKVDIIGYRWLAFWKKPEAHFLCIEPWHGHDDFNEVTGDFSQREGTLILKPNRIFTTSQCYEAGVKENRNV
mgnify:CR=1 FL=1